MKLKFTILSALAALLMVSCESDPNLNPDIQVTTESVTISDEAQQFSIEFDSNEHWSMAIAYNQGTEEWIDASRYVGGDGKQVVTLTASKNYTGDTRTAGIQIQSYGKVQDILVTQQKIEYEQRRVGMYILNEGFFNRGDASLALYDPTTKTSTPDYYGAQNDGEKLGDVANDIIVYGGKTYVVVNNSQKVVVLNAYNGEKVGTVDLAAELGGTPNPRYAVAAEGKVYVSTWANGVVAIDTTDFAIKNTIALSQAFSEGIVAHEGNLYVANSGKAGDYYGGQGNTISIVSLESETETGTIEVPLNPNIIKMSSDGKMYLSTWGDYFTTECTLQEIDYKNKTVAKTWNEFPVSKFDITDKYIYGYNFSYITYGMFFSRLDISTGEMTSFDASAADQLRSVHSISVDPTTNDVFYACQSGVIAWFDQEGSLKEQFDPTDESNVGVNTTKVLFRDLTFEK